MDIRAFFGGGAKGKPKAEPKKEDKVEAKKEDKKKEAKKDEGVKRKSPQKTPADDAKKKAKVKEIDSDEDFVEEKPKKKAAPEPPAKKEIDAKSFFAAPVKASSPKKKAAKEEVIAIDDDEEEEKPYRPVSVVKRSAKDEAAQDEPEEEEEEEMDEEAMAAALLFGEDEDNDASSATAASASTTKAAAPSPAKKAKTASPAKPAPPSSEEPPKKKALELQVQPEKMGAKIVSVDSSDDEGGAFVPAQLAKKGKASAAPATTASPAKQTSAPAPAAAPATKPPLPPSSAPKPPAASDKTDKDSAAKKDADKAGAEKEKATPVAKWNYHEYQRRANMAPPNLGSKEIPKGAENCLSGLKFVLTGLLDSLERDTASDLIKEYGGVVQGSLSKNVTYLLAGTEPGPSKVEKAKECGVKIIGEDDLLEMIRTRPAGKPAAPAKGGKKAAAASSASSATAQSASPSKGDSQDSSAAPAAAPAPKSSNPYAKSVAAAKKSAEMKKMTPSESAPAGPAPVVPAVETYQLWTDKYAPTELSKIIGQQGDRSNMKKLKHWLDNWHKNRDRADKKSGGKDDTGADKAAVLMYGPPGVGKTTTATLVCRACGYEVIELNASDTRSKSLLEEKMGSLVGNTTMTQFFGVKGSEGEKPRTMGKKMAIIMDEIDGMGGNEDRGGVGEVIALIKKSKMPIICIANELPQKLKSLRNYTFELQFRKMQPRVIRDAMLAICKREGVDVDDETMDAIIEATNCDIRQVLNNLYMWSRNSKVLRISALQKNVEGAVKPTTETPWEWAPKFWNSRRNLKLDELVDAFFQDYSMAPLWVQENYINVRPVGVKSPVEALERLSMAADAIADGELISNQMMARSDFSTLPLLAIVSCIRPGFFMAGVSNAQLKFSTWFGNYSKEGRLRRACAELQTHMRLDTGADSATLRMSYLPHMRERLVQPLLRGPDHVTEVTDFMDAYHLNRTDWDSINDICQFEGLPNPTSTIDSKTKAAFTRAYNKTVHLQPYSEIQAAKKKKGSSTSEMGGFDDGEYGEEDGEEDEGAQDEEDSLDDSAMIKAKTNDKDSKKAAGSAKGKGKAK